MIMLFAIIGVIVIVALAALGLIVVLEGIARVQFADTQSPLSAKHGVDAGEPYTVGNEIGDLGR